MEEAAKQKGISLSEYCVSVLASASGNVEPEYSYEAPDRKRRAPKDQTIAIRISTEDKEIIAARAKEIGLSVGEYMIRSARNDKTVIILDGKDILHQLSKLGTNLNQLTILAHKGRISALDLDDINQTLKKLLKVMQKTMKGSARNGNR